MLKIAVVALALSAGFVHAEEKNCAVKGMHCADCVSSVQSKVCEGDKFATCDVTLGKGKKDPGQLHLITKDSAAKIDEKDISAKVKDAGYSLEKCSNKKGKG